MTIQRVDYARYVWLWLLALGAALLVYLLRPILSPFLFAAIIAYMCDPLVDRLETHKLSRTVATVLVLILVICVAALLVLIMLPLLQREIALLAQRTPDYLATFNDRLIPWLNARFGIALPVDGASLKATLAGHMQSAEGLAAKLFSSLKIGGLAIIGFLVNLLLLPVVLFYLLRDWDLLVAKIDQMIPRRWHHQIRALAVEIDAVLGQFLRGQISIMLIMSAYYSTGLWISGLDVALPIGMLTGMLGFVPYLGMITGLILATFAGLMQFTDWPGLIGVWIVFAVGQGFEAGVLTPWLMGERIGLHPVVVIFALLAFGQVFGFVGILLALPASAALLVWLRHLRRRYLDSRIYTD